MTTLFNFFEKIAEQYGIAVAIVIGFIVFIIYTVYIINKNYASIIKKYLEDKLVSTAKDHSIAAFHRKNVTPKIRNKLLYLAKEVNADRVLVFEFSNGSSNLVGLPFLYTTATCEVITAGTSVVSQKYQKINTTLIATFLENLEEKGYFYAEDIEEIKSEHPTVYAFMKPNGVKSLLFYSLYGVDDTIGFIAVTSVGEHSFSREDALPKVASTAQSISSLLNYNTISNND